VRIFPLLLAAVLLAGLVGPVRADELDDALARQRELAAALAAQAKALAALAAEQKSLDASLAAASSSLAQTSANLAVVRADLAKASDVLARTRAELARLEGEIDRLDTQLARLEGERLARERDLAARQALLASRLREAYIADRTPVLWILLSGQSFTDLLVDLAGFNTIGRRDVVLADAIRADAERIARLQAEVSENRASTDRMRASAAAQKRSLDRQVAALDAARRRLAALAAEQTARIAAQKAAIAKVIANKAKLAELVAALKAEEAQTAALIARLMENRGGVPTVYKGGFTWPVVRNASGFALTASGRRPYISQNFGCVSWSIYPRKAGCPSSAPYFHNGLDISAPPGTPLYAAAAGKVLVAGICGYCRVWPGMRPLAWIWIAHSAELVTMYGHVGDGLRTSEPRWVVRAGQFVGAGQLIGYVGSTGNVTGPHLHLSAIYRGEYVDVRRYLP
jgi:murein DD-endopeptidase MepM/ murein hydrolase activator NlpD